jgi:hypothetical protein
MDLLCDGMKKLRIQMKDSTKRNRRCDANGRAFAGSQRQIQYYVNEAPDKLQEAISNVLSIPSDIRWVSPLCSDQYREYKDSAFLRAVGLYELRDKLTDFWPSGGPVWDALGVVQRVGTGVLLLEAKSHVSEISGNGCGAKAETSVKKIEASLNATKHWLGVRQEIDWRGELYQTANRLAHLYFFREVLQRDAWLANVYFTDDRHSRTSRSEWDEAVSNVKTTLGISEIPHYADVYLPALC